MSEITTNTPSGGSKNNLYEKNKNNDIVTNFTDISELDPAKEVDLTENKPGDNTVVGTPISIDISDAIRNNGYVEIDLHHIGKSLPDNPDNRKIIKDEVNEFLKNELARKGVMRGEDYIKYRMERAEAIKEGIDRDNNEINEKNENNNNIEK